LPATPALENPISQGLAPDRMPTALPLPLYDAADMLTELMASLADQSLPKN